MTILGLRRGDAPVTCPAYGRAMDIHAEEGPVGFLSLRLEQTEIGFVATITTNPNIADRLGDRVHRFTDPDAVYGFTQAFIARWLSDDSVMRR